MGEEMRKIGLVAAMAALLLITGCFQVKQEVTLKKDGSGKITEEVLFSDAMAAQMQKMATAFGGQSNDASNTMYKPEKLKQEALSYGDDVRYITSSAVSHDGFTGYSVTYGFKDINTLKLSNDPSGKTMKMGVSDENEGYYQFSFKKGRISTLTIREVDSTEEDDDGEWEEAEEYEEDDEEDMGGMNEQMMQMFKDMRIFVSIVFDGKIVKTNAMYQDGNRVTLMDIDYNKIIGDEDAMKTLGKAQNLDSLDEAKKVMKDIEGIKMELQDKVTVSFK